MKTVVVARALPHISHLEFHSEPTIKVRFACLLSNLTFSKHIILVLVFFLESQINLWENCVCSDPFKGNMEIKPKETGIWALTINDKTIIILVHYIYYFGKLFQNCPLVFPISSHQSSCQQASVQFNKHSNVNRKFMKSETWS